MLETDASNYGIGAVLVQESHPVGYASRALSKTEKRASATERELEAVAVHWGCLQFRVYLAGRKFTLVTDHQPLAWILPGSAAKTQHQNVRLLRWALNLQEFQFDIKYRPGPQMILADGLSRAPLTEADHREVERMSKLGDEHPERVKQTEAFERKAKETLEYLEKLQQGWTEDGQEEEPIATRAGVIGAVTADQQAEQLARTLEELTAVRTPTFREFLEAQQQDTLCASLRFFGERGVIPPELDAATQRQVERLGSSVYVSPSGLVYRALQRGEVTERNNEPEEDILDELPTMRVVVPAALRGRVIGALHDSQFAAHMGAIRTMRRVAQRFWCMAHAGQRCPRICQAVCCLRNGKDTQSEVSE